MDYPRSTKQRGGGGDEPWTIRGTLNRGVEEAIQNRGPWTIQKTTAKCHCKVDNGPPRIHPGQARDPPDLICPFIIEYGQITPLRRLTLSLKRGHTEPKQRTH